MREPLSVRRAEGETCGGGARSAWGEGASQGKLDEVTPQAIYKHIKNRLTKRREGERERQASRTQPKPQRVHALWQGRDSEGGGWSGWQGPGRDGRCDPWASRGNSQQGEHEQTGDAGCPAPGPVSRVHPLSRPVGSFFLKSTRSSRVSHKVPRHGSECRPHPIPLLAHRAALTNPPLSPSHAPSLTLLSKSYKGIPKGENARPFSQLK